MIILRHSLLLLFTFLVFHCQAQRMLLIEKVNSARTQKIYEGMFLQYQLAEDEDWYQGEIMELRPDIQAIVFEDRIVSVDKIVRLRQRRAWPLNLGYTLATFGVAWSGWALIGTATDGNPDTRYEGSDAIVTGVAVGSGLLLAGLLGNKKLRFGEGRKRRLRVVDVSF